MSYRFRNNGVLGTTCYLSHVIMVTLYTARALIIFLMPPLLQSTAAVLNCIQNAKNMKKRLLIQFFWRKKLACLTGPFAITYILI